MYSSIPLVCILLNIYLSSATESNQDVTTLAKREPTLAQVLSSIGLPKTLTNRTHFDNDENSIRVPDFNSHFEVIKSRRKVLKKSPKRTVQKIIKRNQMKRKQLLMQRQSVTTSPAPVEVNDEKYVDENSEVRRDESSTEPQLKKRNKKWYPSKLPKYPKPYHSRRDDYRQRRYRRDVTKDTRYILTDFDETEILSEGKDQETVNAHFKKYW